MIGLDDPIVAPPACGRLECEAELAVVMKRRCRNVAPARARDYVLGYTALNDVTARDIHLRDGDWTRAKAFDTFCPVGPGIATDLDPNAVTIETWVNGSCVRVASTKELVVPVEDLVARVSEVMTLLPGDVLATGSPGMAAPIAPGDRIEIRIDGVGCLKNTVVRL
jgi:2-keto-4-pentenoate hydratase/2-oxohepta-3-ene-1,7-dioic acid hydratase in catechol pathway